MTNRKLIKFIRPEEFKKLITVIPKTDHVSRIAFLLSYAAGLRVSEVVRCSPEHFRENSLFIPESKYGVERIVPIPKGWKKDFIQKLPLIKKDINFQSKCRILNRRFNKYRKKAKLPSYYSYHSLRHGFAMRSHDSGMSLANLQVLLGHANIKTTSEYLKANPTDALKSYEELF